MCPAASGPGHAVCCQTRVSRTGISLSAPALSRHALGCANGATPCAHQPVPAGASAGAQADRRARTCLPGPASFPSGLGTLQAAWPPLPAGLQTHLGTPDLQCPVPLGHLRRAHAVGDLAAKLDLHRPGGRGQERQGRPIQRGRIGREGQTPIRLPRTPILPPLSLRALLLPMLKVAAGEKAPADFMDVALRDRAAS